MAQILVIEDDPLVGKTLIDLLSLHGYAASGAESGEQGLERLQKEASTSCCSTSGCPACPATRPASASGRTTAPTCP